MNKTTIIAEPGRHDLEIIREFDAPREIVFKAHVDPALFVQWQGPHRLTTVLETFEPRTGGSWRFVQKDPRGDEYCFHGVYHDVAPNERIIGTFEFEGLPDPGHVSLGITTFEALPGNRTRLKGLVVFLTVDDRDQMTGAGMEHGVTEGYERLDTIVESLRD